MKMKLRVAIPVSAVSAAFLLASCSPGDLLEGAVESGIESATGSEIDIDEDSGEFSVSSEDGEMSFGTGAELPDEFPDEVPLVDGEIMSSMRIKDETSDGFSVSMMVDGDIADVHSEAAGLLEGAGFTESSLTDMGEMRNSGYEGSGAVAGVLLSTVADVEEGTVVVGYIVTMAVPE